MFNKLVNLGQGVLLTATGPDISGGRTWLQSDGIYVLGVIAAFYVIKEWKSSNFFKIFSILVVYGIAVSLLKGQEILSFIGGVLRFFGFETGL